MLRSDLCDYSDAYITAKVKNTVADSNNNEYDKKLAPRNNAPFISCIYKITLIDNAEDFDIVMPMYIYIYIYLELRFTPCKTEQQLQGMEL